MASTPGKKKATFELSADAKYRLSVLKAELRRRMPEVQTAVVSEAAIVEQLVLGADAVKLEAALRKAAKLAGTARSGTRRE